MRVHDYNMNLCKGRHWKKEGVVGRKRPPSPVSLYQRRRHLEIWRCQNENSAFGVLSWRHSRDVPSGFRAITTPRSRMLEKDDSFFNVISTASLWDLRLWLQWGEGMWACVRIESIIVNVFSHRTYYNALFIVFFFSGVFARWRFRDAWSKAGDFCSITGRPGAIRWRLTTRVSHLIVTETLCLSSTATLCRCSITCWCNCKCRPITGRIKYSLT